MVKEIIYGKMVIDMRVIGLMGINKEMEHFIGLITVGLKAIGRMIK